MAGDMYRISKDAVLTDENVLPVELTEEMEALALEILKESRKDLMMALRFMSTPLWKMPLKADKVERTLATNGRILRFDPRLVTARYKKGPEEICRDLLHSVLHCIFRHPYDSSHYDRSAWFLACDISMELTIIDLCGERFPSYRDTERKEAGERLEAMAGALTTKALYKLLGQDEAGIASRLEKGISDEDFMYLSELFSRDNHEMWVHGRDTERGEGEGDTTPLPDVNNVEKMETAEEQVQGDGGSKADDEEGSFNPNAEDSAEGDGDDASATGENGEAEISEKEWEELSKRIRVEIESMSQAQGGDAGSLLQALKIANRKPCDYGGFLKQFAAMGEDLVSNDDEFDYIYYTYGLNRYGNMPLIEPLEYKEDKRIREFVVALDTSESCSGNLIRTFIERTYDVLHQTGNFGAKVNIHIVQCDSKVQSDTKITSAEELDRYCSEFWVAGFGSTDFRPAFEYVDAMIARGEFEDLKGLIYFTDGLGTFPSKCPEYDTAFVFVSEDGTHSVKVPPWAIRITLTEDEIKATKASMRRR